MTSESNAREIMRLRRARERSVDSLARQARLVERLRASAGGADASGGEASGAERWASLAALARLAGGAGAAAQLSGLSVMEIEEAVGGVDHRAVERVLLALRHDGSGRSRAR